MPKSIGTLINELALKAGVKADDPGLKDILSNAELSKVTVSDDLTATIESGLHTLSSAAANKTLKDEMRKQMTAEILNGVDAEMKRSYNELGLPEDVQKELDLEPNTGKRAAKLAAKVKELASAQSKGKTPEEMQKLIEEVNNLKSSLGNKDKEWQQKLTETETKYINELTQQEINTLLSQYNYALGDNVPANVKLLTAQGVLQNALHESGFKIVKNNGRLELLAENGSEAFDKSNNKLTLKSFMDSSVSGIIKKSDPPPTGGGNPYFTPPGGNGEPAVNVNQKAIEQLEASASIFGNP